MQDRARGESWVYLTAVGMSLGLLMIFGILSVIVMNGVKAFWPRPIMQVEISSESDRTFDGGKIFAGELFDKQERIIRNLEEREAVAKSGETPMEWKFFVGNRDVHGESFLWIDRNDIAKQEFPEDILFMERMEYGPAIAMPKRLELPDGESIGRVDKRFYEELSRLNTETNDRRAQIRELEEKEIGKISYRMQQLRYKKDDLSDSSDEFREIEEELETLQKKYQKLADQATELREEQKAASLTYELASGETKTIPMGQLIRFYYPNQLNWFERFGWFWRNAWAFVSNDPREANTDGGVFPAIFGTFIMVILLSLAVTPLGVLAALYLHEYASKGVMVRTVWIAVNNLAGVPSIVFGAFGLGFFVYVLGGSIDALFFQEKLPTPTFGTGGMFWAAMTLALMTVPQVIVATVEALAAVPRSMREGSLACGASKWQTIQRIILPHAIPGIITGVILAMAHGAGEVAPLMLVGVVKLAPSLPVDGIFPYLHLERKFMHLGFHIFDLGFQSPDSEAARPMVFATTLLLILIVIVLNLAAIFLREQLRRKYSSATF